MVFVVGRCIREVDWELSSGNPTAFCSSDAQPSSAVCIDHGKRDLGVCAPSALGQFRVWLHHGQFICRRVGISRAAPTPQDLSRLLSGSEPRMVRQFLSYIHLGIIRAGTNPQDVSRLLHSFAQRTDRQ